MGAINSEREKSIFEKSRAAMKKSQLTHILGLIIIILLGSRENLPNHFCPIQIWISKDFTQQACKAFPCCWSGNYEITPTISSHQKVETGKPSGAKFSKLDEQSTQIGGKGNLRWSDFCQVTKFLLIIFPHSRFKNFHCTNNNKTAHTFRNMDKSGLLAKLI